MLEAMGFSPNAIARALAATVGASIEVALEWCIQHANDAGINEPLHEVQLAPADNARIEWMFEDAGIIDKGVGVETSRKLARKNPLRYKKGEQLAMEKKLREIKGDDAQRPIYLLVVLPPPPPTAAGAKKKADKAKETKEPHTFVDAAAALRFLLQRRTAQPAQLEPLMLPQPQPEPEPGPEPEPHLDADQDEIAVSECTYLLLLLRLNFGWHLSRNRSSNLRTDPEVISVCLFLSDVGTQPTGL